MVQSIFDDQDESPRPADAGPVQPAHSSVEDDDPFGFGDVVHAAPPPPPRSEPQVVDPIAEPPVHDPVFGPPPSEVRVQPPPTQLDGQQRVEPVYQDRSVYEDDWYRPDLDADNVRRSGLAWSAGVIFFGSVAFMLFVGWGADLLFGSSPWGLVLGIVLGSVIGFIQFFRISSQIYQEQKDSPKVSPLMSARHEDEDGDKWD